MLVTKLQYAVQRDEARLEIELECACLTGYQVADVCHLEIGQGDESNIQYQNCNQGQISNPGIPKWIEFVLNLALIHGSQVIQYGGT